MSLNNSRIINQVKSRALSGSVCSSGTPRVKAYLGRHKGAGWSGSTAAPRSHGSGALGGGGGGSTDAGWPFTQEARRLNRMPSGKGTLPTVPERGARHGVGTDSVVCNLKESQSGAV